MTSVPIASTVSNSTAQVLGRFTLERLLARTASGATWLAIDAKSPDEPHVALKLFNSQFGALFKRNSIFSDRLERMRGRTIPGLPTLRTFGREHGQYYAAFSWQGGDPLDQLVATGLTEVPPAKRHRLVRQLARGLNALHWGGFLHLSLSPSTILYQPGRSSLRLIDWGHMVPTSDAELMGLSFPGVSLDVAPYTSAGAMAGGTVDVRDDIYSFGCVAYELLIGAHPYDRRFAREATALGLVPGRAPDLDGPQNLALFNALALDTARRNVTLDAIARAFTRRRRPQPLQGAWARAQRIAPARTLVLGMAAMLVLAIGLAFGLTRGGEHGAVPAPVAGAQPTPQNRTEVKGSNKDGPRATVAAAPSALAAQLNSAAIGIDGSPARRAERDAAREAARAARNDPDPDAAIGVSISPPIQIAAVPMPAQGIVVPSSPAVIVVSPPSPPMPLAPPPLASDPTRDSLAMSRPLNTECFQCDCRVLTHKRSFTTEPLRREEQEFLRRNCG
ncbi:MAG: serine/threonine protein kinase [Burkholderiales bacterium]